MIPLRRLISSVFRWSRFCERSEAFNPVMGRRLHLQLCCSRHNPPDSSSSRQQKPKRCTTPNLRSQSRRRSASNTVESRSLFPAHPALSSFTARSTTAKGRSADCWVCNTTTDSKEAARINVTCFIYRFSCSAEVVVVREHHCLRASPDA